MHAREQHTGGCASFADETARDLYTRAQQPYLRLRQEAELAHLLKSLPRRAKPGQPALARRLALLLANGLITAGQQIRLRVVNSSEVAGVYRPAGQD